MGARTDLGAVSVLDGPAAALLDRLNDPATAAAVGELLDSAGTLSGLLTVVGSFLARGEEVMDNVASSYHELAGPVASSALLPRLTDPALVELLTALLGAVGTARASVAADPVGHELGLLGIARVTKDPDVRRGIGFTLAVMKELGRSLGPTPH